MTATATPASTGTAPRRQLGQKIVRVLTTTDHKVIGNLYLGTSFCWFLIAGLMAMLMLSGSAALAHGLHRGFATGWQKTPGISEQK